MQGRLSPVVGGHIQAFPWEHWRSEFALAASLGFERMEWTLDDERLRENPYVTDCGQREIDALAREHGVRVVSLTGDFLMQAPFFAAEGAERARRLDDLKRVVAASASLGVEILVFPVVDVGRLRDERDEADLIEVMTRIERELEAAGLRVAFESDYPPRELARLLKSLPPALFGVNYDMGNSAALGYDASEEMEGYGDRVINLHVKDRPRGGGTVPLGEGDVDFPGVIALLEGSGYRGNYILQTARSAEGRHAEVLAGYRDRVAGWLQGVA